MQPFQLVDGSEENPPPPVSRTQTRLSGVEARPARVDGRPHRVLQAPFWVRWSTSYKSSGIIAVVFMLFYSFFIVGASIAEVRPVPKTAFSRNFKVSNFLSAGLFVCAFFSATILVSMFGRWACSSPRYTRSRGCTACGLCIVMISSMITIYAVVISLGWLIPLFAAPAIAYPKLCKDAWIEVELESPRYNATSQSIATFSRVDQGHREQLFAFTTSSTDSAEFNISPVNVTAPSVLPSLQMIRLDDSTNHIQGTCYKNDNDTTSGPCGVVGYVWPFSNSGPLSFELWYTAANGSISTLRARNWYRNWSQADKPSILLHRASTADWRLGERLLQTTFPEPPGCTGRTKLCISRTADSGDGVLGPDVLVAVRWISHIWAAFTLDCSKPSS